MNQKRLATIILWIAVISEEELMIVQVLRDGLYYIDKLAQRTKVEIPKFLSLLATLEVKGVIKSMGGTYVLTT